MNQQGNMHKKILILLLLLFSISCKNKTNKRISFVNALCCEKESTKFKIESLNINSSNFLEIGLSNIEVEQIRVTLERASDTTQLLFDLLSKDKILNKRITIDNNSELIFKGNFNNVQILDGDYVLNLGDNRTCGMIVFNVKNQKIVNKKYYCVIEKSAKGFPR